MISKSRGSKAWDLLNEPMAASIGTEAHSSTMVRGVKTVGVRSNTQPAATACSQPYFWHKPSVQKSPASKARGIHDPAHARRLLALSPVSQQSSRPHLHHQLRGSSSMISSWRPFIYGPRGCMTV